MPQHSDDTEARILEAAHRVFVRRGTAGARTQEIADEADVNKALLHYYFRTKQKLAEAVFLRAARTVFPEILGTLASDLPLREKLNRVIDAELTLLTENPFIPGFLLAEFQYRHEDLRILIEQAFPLEKMRGAVLESLQRQLDEEAEAGRLRPTPAVDLAVALISQIIFPFAAAPMLHVVLGLGPEERRAVSERQREHLADALLRSLAPDDDHSTT